MSRSALDILTGAGLTTGPGTLQVAKVHTDLAYRMEVVGDVHTVALADTGGRVTVTFFSGPDTLRRARTFVSRMKRGETQPPGEETHEPPEQ